MKRFLYWEGWPVIIFISILLGIAWGIVEVRESYVRSHCDNGHIEMKWNYAAKMKMAECVDGLTPN